MRLVRAYSYSSMFLIACFAAASLSHGQTAEGQTAEGRTAEEAGQAKDGTGTAPGSPQLEAEEDLYILPDLPDTAPAAGLDLGKVGKKGELSFERMPLDRDGEIDQRRRGAAGVRLKIPLGKQAP